ncbi:MAG: hypothetical protein WC656_01640 [Sulfurimonas sp.]|jgi:hypothetical protein
MDANQQNAKAVKDGALTPSQRNRAKKERQRLARANNSAANTTPVVQKNTFVSEQEVAPAPVRLTDEEYTQNILDKKSAKVEKNPKGSVVSTAETSESRALAFKVDEVNMITDFTRSNMGTDRLSFDDGAVLIKMFKHNVTDNLAKFIEQAYSFGIGSKWALREYKEAQRVLKANEDRIAKEREKSISSETTAETKEREAQEQAVKKALLELEKAEEALAKAQEAKMKAIAEQDSGYEQRIIAQNERQINERAEAKAKAEQGKKDADAAKATAKESTGETDGTKVA